MAAYLDVRDSGAVALAARQLQRSLRREPSLANHDHPKWERGDGKAGIRGMGNGTFDMGNGTFEVVFKIVNVP